jgi:hypothetical protein
MEVPEDSAMLLTLQIEQLNLVAPALVDFSLEASYLIAPKKRSFAVPIKGYRKLAYAPVFAFCLNVFSQCPKPRDKRSEKTTPPSKANEPILSTLDTSITPTRRSLTANRRAKG